MSSRSQGFDGDSGASAGACHCSLASDMGRFTNDQFRFDQYLLAEFLRPTNPVQDALRGNSSYVCERLAYRSEPRMAERRELNIVETDDRHIEGHAQSHILQRAHGSNGGHIVEGNQRCKGLAGCLEFTDDRIAELRG